MQSSAVAVVVSSLPAIFFILFFYTQAIAKDIYLGSNQPRPAGWSEKDWQEWRDYFFNYDWAKIVWDSWPKARFRQKLIEDCGYRFKKEKVNFRGDKIGYVQAIITPKNTKPGTFAHWHQANRSEWQKYKTLANQLPDDPDELLKAIAKIDKLTVAQRKGFGWHFRKGTPAESILEYKPKDMDVEYFKTCHDIYIIYYFWYEMAHDVFTFPREDVELLSWRWKPMLARNLFYDSIYNIPDWFRDDIADQLKTTPNWKYMRQD